MEQERTQSEILRILERVRNRRTLPTLFSVGALAFGGVGLAACGEDSAGPETGGSGAGAEAVQEEEGVVGEEEEGVGLGEEEESANAEDLPGEVTLSELAGEGNEAAFLGEEVTVSGEVAEENVDRETATDAAFTIGGEIDEQLLVLPNSELTPQGINVGEVVRVVGTVIQIDETTVEEEDFLFEEEGVDDAFLDEFQGDKAIVATQIDTNVPAEQDEE